jgi:hypothetical protein
MHYGSLNNTFNNTLALLLGQFYHWRKPECLEKMIDLLQATDKCYHISTLLGIGIKHTFSGDSHWFHR